MVTWLNLEDAYKEYYKKEHTPSYRTLQRFKQKVVEQEEGYELNFTTPTNRVFQISKESIQELKNKSALTPDPNLKKR